MPSVSSSFASSETARGVTVSVILSTFNRAHFLRVALDSLLAQTRAVDEILVVDDASTDCTPAVLERYGDRLRVLRRTANAGKPANLNFAIPQARGDYLWLFDDDDAALPDALENHLAYLQARPEIDFSYSDKYLFAGDGDIWDRTYWDISPLPDVPPQDFLVRTMLSMNTLLQGMLIPARCFKTVGSFDESLKRCEDHDMLLRLARDYCAGNMGQPTFVYREHEGVRGAGDNSHAATQRYRVMLDYRRKIFRRMREHFPLSSYLPGDATRTPPKPVGIDEALALLQRSCVMFRHGLVTEALADLETALADARVRRVESPEARHILSQSLDLEPWIWPSWRRDLYQLGRLLRRRRAYQAGQFLARGIYWNARRDWHNNARRQALVSMNQLAYFLGVLSVMRLMPSASRL